MKIFTNIKNKLSAFLKKRKSNRINEIVGVIQESDQYFTFKMPLLNHYVTVRSWKNGITDIKFDDDFAISTGFKDLSDLLHKKPEIKEIIYKYGQDVPPWSVIVKGEFYIKIEDEPLFSNINPN